MNNHVLRPVFVVIALIIVYAIARYFFVPADFKVSSRGFMYGYHRLGNEAEWEKFKPKYKSREYCQDCHDKQFTKNASSNVHKIIQCENCHGPAVDHPDAPEKLPIDRAPELCLRCHFKLPYPTSKRGEIKGIDPKEHNPGAACVECHDPHHPDLEG